MPVKVMQTVVKL